MIPFWFMMQLLAVLMLPSAIVGVFFFLYYLPWLIASSRGHFNLSGVFLMNTLTGWTILGWFWSLYMAVNPSAQVKPS